MKKILVLLLAVFLVSCQQSFHEEVDATRAYELAQSGVQVIDLRTPEEYDAGNIAGSKMINFRSETFEDELNALNKNQEYIIHCKSGGRSAQAYEKMQDLGFIKVYHYSGGFDDWQAQGLPVSS